MLFATLLLWLVPDVLVRIFLDTGNSANEQVLGIAIAVSFWAGLFQLVDGGMIVYSNGLRGLRDTQGPLWIAMFGYWIVGLGVGSWLCLTTDHGVTGLWWGLILGAVVALSLMVFRFRDRLRATELALATASSDS